MKPLRILSGCMFAAALVLTSLFTPATGAPKGGGTGYATFNYKVCQSSSYPFGKAYVCLTFYATRQANNVGMIVHHVRYYTNLPSEDGDDCGGPQMDDPSVTTHKVAIVAVNNSGDYIGKWSKDGPNLNNNNHCVVEYSLSNEPGGVVTMNQRRSHVMYDYTIHLHGFDDDQNALYVWFNTDQDTGNLEWYCDKEGFGDPSKCERSLV